MILNFTGLTCYSCTTDGAGLDCIDEPNKFTTVECVKDDGGDTQGYCYIIRHEEIDEETKELSNYDVHYIDLLF